MLFIQGDIGNYYYGQGHPMKPHRIRMTHNLLLNYGLYRKMEIYVSRKNYLPAQALCFLKTGVKPINLFHKLYCFTKIMLPVQKFYRSYDGEFWRQMTNWKD